MISVSAIAQKDTAKVDTTAWFFREVGDSLTIKNFNEWAIDNMTARKYGEFQQIYAAYLQQKFDAWIKRKKK